MGAQLAGMRSALVMQNSGIGNLLNGWASLAYNYGISIPWIVSDRGSMGEQVMTQTIWHGRLRAILKAAQIPPGRSSQRQTPGSRLIRPGWVCDAPMRRCAIPYDFWRDDLTARCTGADVTLPPHTACQPVYVGEVPRILAPHGAASRCSKVSWQRYTTSFYLLH